MMCYTKKIENTQRLRNLSAHILEFCRVCDPKRHVPDIRLQNACGPEPRFNCRQGKCFPLIRRVYNRRLSANMTASCPDTRDVYILRPWSRWPMPQPARSICRNPIFIPGSGQLFTSYILLLAVEQYTTTLKMIDN